MGFNVREGCTGAFAHLGKIMRRECCSPDSSYEYKNCARISARLIKHPPKGVPREDIIRLRFYKPKSKNAFTMWMRPDEAAATVSVLGHVLWLHECRQHVLAGGT